MPRILLHADAGAHTGFATVSHAIGDRLVDRGWDVHCLALNYKGDYWPTKMKLYPASLSDPLDTIGASRIVEMLGKLMPDVVLAINDPHVILTLLADSRYDPDHILWRGITNGTTSYRPPIVAYMPIDGYESPRSWDVLAERVIRVAMSEFGKRTAMPEAKVIWHGVDTSVFYPRDKRESKVALGFDPDSFLVLRVDKNTWRKDYPASWKAMRPILRKYPNVALHFHCRPAAMDGYNLNAVRWNDEDIRDRVTFSPSLDGFTGWSSEHLATLYSAADLFLSTSWGEGFGLTVLEAMACGTPVVAQDCSAITEVVGPGGVLIAPKGRISVPMGQEQCLPNVKQFSAAIERLYLDRGRLARLGEAATEHARRFSWDVAAMKFDAELRAAISPSPEPSTAA